MSPLGRGACPSLRVTRACARGKVRAVRPIQSLIVATLLVLAAVPAFAQGDLEDLVKGDGPKIEKSRVDDGRPSPPEIDEVRLGVQWGIYRGATGEAKDRLLDKELDMARILGIDNQPERAVSLLLAAQTAAASGDGAQATLLVDQADLLAPDLPAVEFARARLGGIFALGSLIRAWSEAWGFLPSRVTMMNSGIVTLALLLGLLAVFLAVVVLVRYLRLLSGDLSRLLPRGISPTQVGIFVLLLIVGAGLLSQSPLVSVVLSVVLMAAYMNWSERAAAVLVLAGLALLPDAASLANAGLQFSGSKAQTYASYARFGCLSACGAELATQTAAATPDEDPRFVHSRKFLLATAAVRRGARSEWPGAKDILFALSKDPTVDPAMHAPILNNLGIAQVLVGDDDAALATFQTSARLQPGAYDPHLNIARVLEIKGDTAGAEKARQEAIRIGSDAAAERSTESRRVVSLFFKTMSLPTGPLFDAHIAQSRLTPAPSLSFWRRIGGRLSLEQMPTLAMGAGGIFVVLIVLGLFLGAARRCPQCGGNMVAREDSEVAVVDGICKLCSDCYEGGGSVPYHTRVRHDARVDRYGLVSKWTFRVGNAVGFGLGSTIRGSYAGVWVGALTLFGLSILATTPPALRDPWRLIELYDDGLAAVGVILIALAMIASALLLVMGNPERRKQARGKSKPAPREGR